VRSAESIDTPVDRDRVGRELPLMARMSWVESDYQDRQFLDARAPAGCC